MHAEAKLAEFGIKVDELDRILERTDQRVRARIEAFNESIRVHVKKDIEDIASSLRSVLDIVDAIAKEGSINVDKQIMNARTTIASINPFR